jgi:hypothetical protein
MNSDQITIGRRVSAIGIWRWWNVAKIPVEVGKSVDSDVLTISGLRLCLAFASLQLAV